MQLDFVSLPSSSSTRFGSIPDHLDAEQAVRFAAECMERSIQGDLKLLEVADADGLPVSVHPELYGRFLQHRGDDRGPARYDLVVLVEGNEVGRITVCLGRIPGH